MTARVDFTAFRHPVLAVECPACGKRPGAWCIRPSGHKAQSLHRDRRDMADLVHATQGDPEILNTTGGKQTVGYGIWRYGKPIPAGYTGR